MGYDYDYDYDRFVVVCNQYASIAIFVQKGPSLGVCNRLKHPA